MKWPLDGIFLRARNDVDYSVPQMLLGGRVTNNATDGISTDLGHSRATFVRTLPATAAHFCCAWAAVERGRRVTKHLIKYLETEATV